MILKPITINSDVSLKALKPEQASYILNQIRNEGGVGKNTDVYANDQLAEIDTPPGESYGVGYFYDEQTKDLYKWHWNEKRKDFITRTKNGVVEKVYEGNLNLSIDPAHSIWPFRAFLIYDPQKKFGKHLVWCDGDNDEIKCLDIELSILTDSFTVPYFSSCTPDLRQLTLLDVAQPLNCVTAKIDSTVEPLKKNSIINQPWQFRFKWIYYDNREGEWSPISTTYWVDQQVCFSGSGPRCFDLRIPVGPSFVVKYVVGYRNDNSGTWFESEILERFGPYTGTEEWWEREQILDLDTDECFFIHKFCADKGCNVIPPDQTNRNRNPKPLTAQCLIPIDNRLAFINIGRGMNPMPQLEKDKVTFEVKPPVDRDCGIEYVDIKVAAVIHQPHHNRNQAVYQMDGVEKGTVFFGGIGPKIDGGFETGYDQVFAGEKRNFTVYIDDGSGNYNIELEQYRISNGNVEEWGVFKNMGENGVRNDVRKLTRNGGFYRQQGTLKVPKGSKGFIRISSHKSAGGEQNTSTSVAGIWKNVIGYSGNAVIQSSNTDLLTKEIYFDTCNGGLDFTDKPFVIMDGAIDTGGEATARSNYMYGYVKDKNGVAIEGAVVAPPAPDNCFFFTTRTDHNGFYFVFLKNDVNSINIQAETACSVFSNIGSVPGGTGRKGAATQYDITYDEDAYDSFKHFIKVKIMDCTGVPLSGVYVAVSGGRGSVSGLNGEAVLSLRNYNSARLVNVVVMQGSDCFLRGCDNSCNPCMDSFERVLPACFTGLTTPLGTVTYKAINTKKYGLKPGGRYEFCLMMHGNGDVSSAQLNDWVLDIPTYQGLAGITFSRVSVVVPTALSLPANVTHISIGRTKNLNHKTYLEWVVDEVEYINSAGESATPESSTYVRLTIQSLLDYNENYFFKTNSVYRYVPGDRCEFITKKDGVLFDKIINLPVISPFAKEKGEDAPADFFNQVIVPFDSALLDIEEGSIISLQTPFDCETKRSYQEICGPIPVKNFKGEIVVNTFDCYRVTRVIKKKLYTLDHHSITDFWGSVDDQGRLFTANQYERRSKLPRDLMITESWNLFGSRNGVNVFSTEDGRTKTFQGWEMGDIVAAKINDASLLTCICQNDFSFSMVGDDFIRTNPDGTIRSNPSDQIISNPQLKLGERMGCEYNDIGSIYFGDGYATWWDSKRGKIAFTDYQNGVDVSDGKIKFHTKRVSEYVQDFNKTAAAIDKVRFVTGFDPLNKWILITVKKIRGSGIFNSYDQPLASDNQTIAFDPKTKDFPTFLSFTPELICDIQNKSFIAVLKCQPYIHEENAKVNEFFGVAVDRVLIVSANENQTKKKRFVALEIQSDSRWLSPKVVTDKATFVSEIPAVKFSQRGDKWNADFLRNINSGGGLYFGSITEGYFAGVTLVKDNTDQLKYGTVDGIKRTTKSESDFIFVKYTEVEQSGLPRNNS